MSDERHMTPRETMAEAWRAEAEEWQIHPNAFPLRCPMVLRADDGAVHLRASEAECRAWIDARCADAALAALEREGWVEPPENGRP